MRRFGVWCRDTIAAWLISFLQFIVQFFVRLFLQAGGRFAAPGLARSVAPAGDSPGQPPEHPLDLRPERKALWRWRGVRAGGARPSRRLLLRLAAGSGLVTLVCAATLLSPLLRVRTVVWTGTTIPEGVCRRVEATALGQPLFVLPERQLRRLAAADIDLVRRPPSTLEVRTAAPAALGVLSSGHVVRGDGRVAEGEAAPGLVQLEGIETRPGERVEPPVRGFLIALRRELGAGPLAPVRARAHGDEWELWLAGGSRVRLRAGDADAQLRKLRVFEQGLRHESLPARIDLRFAGQVVGAPEKRGAAEKRRGRRG